MAIYSDFFGFDTEPFNVTPDSDFIYYSEQHKEALAHMLYGVQERKGFILVTGKVGSGKTTLCRAFLKELGDEVSTALVLNSKMDAREILRAIADDFGLEFEEASTTRDIIDRLNEFVLHEYREGRNVCVVIDESQNLSPEALENLRLLSNLETEKEKLLQMVLVGQPELNSLLGQSELRQLKQRITVRAYLTNLTRDEIEEYIKHRVELANPSHSISFEERVFDRLYEYSGGNPRATNIISDRMFLAAYVDDSREITVDHLEEAIQELSEETSDSDDKDARVLQRIRSSDDQEDTSLSGQRSLKYVSMALVVTLLTGGLIIWMTNSASIFYGPNMGPQIRSGNVSGKTASSDTGLQPDNRYTTLTGDSTENGQRSNPAPKSQNPDRETGGSTGVRQSKTNNQPSELSSTNNSTDTPGSNELSSTNRSQSSSQSNEENPTTDSSKETEVTRELAPEDVNYSGVQSVTNISNPLKIKTISASKAKRRESTHASLSFARYISYVIGRDNLFPDQTRADLFGTINPYQELDEIQIQTLPGYFVNIPYDQGVFPNYGFPTFIEWKEGGRTYVSWYHKSTGQLWHPNRGWINLNTREVQQHWTGNGVYYVQSQLDPRNMYSFGQINQQIIELQKLLNRVGSYQIPTIGRYGPKTRASVRDFQRKHNLLPDGVAGPRTNLHLLQKAGLTQNTFTESQVIDFLSSVESDIVFD